MPDQYINPKHVKSVFSRSAATYDAHAVLQREVADRLLGHLEFTRLRPGRILDIGCGTGYFTGLLRQRFGRAHLVALDIAEPMVGAARGKRKRTFFRRGMNGFIAADALALPFSDTSFDLVCSNLTMQWATNPRRMLAEMRRVLAPGGLLLFSTFGRRSPSHLWQSMPSIPHDRAGLVAPLPTVTCLGNGLM